jgi:hypothetical protein
VTAGTLRGCGYLRQDACDIATFPGIQKSFSAADVVLSSVKGFRNVTLVGLPGGGGSGAARFSKLINSRLTVALSSMASFQRYFL